MKILIIEDELDLQQVMVDFLSKEGYLTEVADRFEIGREKISLYQYGCILLDIAMPGGNGMQLLQLLREQGDTTPVIIISAKGAIDDRVEGLNLGADDYLPKPFHLAELHARVKSAIRRHHQHVDNRIMYKNVVLVPDDRKVLINEEEVQLNRKEFDVFYYFIIRPEKLVQKALLAESIWGDAVDQVDNLDFIYSQIKNLRKKLRDHGALVDIQAVYGVGYKLV
ncbi:response regulator transcription factor [Sphingobacterium sp. lm-10]|uniref:response regulator transcription factor n=1 Tax=Sphingobacterium sp. lm-10 TaxID=2944904 RepID=UPI002020B7BA|nr:response regulator transcription factor [Sphingobacterium sp. lm-10]MCL7987853.1 response regulator transcription factor [Sphingobacterium sp. lm-10]